MESDDKDIITIGGKYDKKEHRFKVTKFNGNDVGGGGGGDKTRRKRNKKKKPSKKNKRKKSQRKSKRRS